MLNWEAVARAELHPLRFAILERLTAPPPDGDPGWSASTLASALNAPIAAPAHHVRALRNRGWLVVVGSRRARGAVQTFVALDGDILVCPRGRASSPPHG
jgi:hypothetical protein